MKSRQRASSELRAVFLNVKTLLGKQMFQHEICIGRLGIYDLLQLSCEGGKKTTQTGQKHLANRHARPLGHGFSACLTHSPVSYAQVNTSCIGDQGGEKTCSLVGSLVKLCWMRLTVILTQMFSLEPVCGGQLLIHCRNKNSKRRSKMEEKIYELW